MEITNEIKAKVFLPYLGQKIQWSRKGELSIESFSAMPKIFGILHAENNDNKALDLQFCKLILRPLSQITDEDAIDVDKMEGWNLYNGGVLSENTNPKDVVAFKLKNRFDFNFITAQFLISKGYDLPQYLLGGKTLQESGLAIYE